MTRRQREILIFVARGYRLVEIAAELGVSERTIRNHVHLEMGILRRLGVRTLPQALAVAAFIDPEIRSEISALYDARAA